MEPWGLGSRFGQWYLVGHDRARRRPAVLPALPPHRRPSRSWTRRAFTPPAGFNVRAELAGLPELPLRHRRRGRPAGPAAGPAQARRAAPAPDGSRRETAGSGRPATAWRCRSGTPRRSPRNSPPTAPGQRGGPADCHGRRRRLRAAADFAAAPVPPFVFPDAGPAKRARKRTSEDQLKRMLQLVPFLVHNQGLHIRRSPPGSAITRKELEEDLRILICSGLPGGLPGRPAGHPVGRRPRLHHPGPGPEPARPLHRGGSLRPADRPGDANGCPKLAEGSALESVTLKLMAAAGEEGLRAGVAVRPGGGARGLRDPGHGPRRPSAPARSCGWSTSRRRGTRLRTRRGPPAALFAGQHLVLRGLLPLRPGPAELPAGPDRRSCTRTAARRPRRPQPTAGFPAKLFTPNDDDTLVVVQLTRQGAGLADDYYAERTAALPDGGLLAEIRFGNTDVAADVRGPARRGGPDPGARGLADAVAGLDRRRALAQSYGRLDYSACLGGPGS